MQTDIQTAIQTVRQSDIQTDKQADTHSLAEQFALSLCEYIVVSLRVSRLFRKQTRRTNNNTKERRRTKPRSASNYPRQVTTKRTNEFLIY